MQDIEKLGAFYLGREYDISAGRLSPNPVMYDSKDLVTHAVCVGMTGSGKTGLVHRSAGRSRDRRHSRAGHRP